MRMNQSLLDKHGFSVSLNLPYDSWIRGILKWRHIMRMNQSLLDKHGFSVPLNLPYDSWIREILKWRHIMRMNQSLLDKHGFSVPLNLPYDSWIREILKWRHIMRMNQSLLDKHGFSVPLNLPYDSWIREILKWRDFMRKFQELTTGHRECYSLLPWWQISPADEMISGNLSTLTWCTEYTSICFCLNPLASKNRAVGLPLSALFPDSTCLGSTNWRGKRVTIRNQMLFEKNQG